MRLASYRKPEVCLALSDMLEATSVLTFMTLAMSAPEDHDLEGRYEVSRDGLFSVKLSTASRQASPKTQPSCESSLIPKITCA